jgi:hypothetical protein
MDNPEKNTTPFARIILLNMLVAGTLIAVGLLIGDLNSVMGVLMLQILVNLAKSFDGNRAAHLLSALVLLLIGLGQCAMS